MRSLILFLFATVWTVNGLIYIDRHTLEFNEKISNFSTNYIRLQNGSSATNLTFISFKTVTKLLIYFTVKAAEDINDRHYRREFIRTVIDVGKFFKNSQTNPILRNIIEEIQQCMNFRASYPMAPVSKKQLKI